MPRTLNILDLLSTRMEILSSDFQRFISLLITSKPAPKSATHVYAQSAVWLHTRVSGVQLLAWLVLLWPNTRQVCRLYSALPLPDVGTPTAMCVPLSTCTFDVCLCQELTWEITLQQYWVTAAYLHKSDNIMGMCMFVIWECAYLIWECACLVWVCA